MESKVAIAGHPIHPMLVPLPIGLLFGSVVADIAYIITGESVMWSNIAFWTLIGGLIMAIVAAAAGFGEYWLLARFTDARDLARTHMTLNLVAVALFFISFLLRLNEVTLTGTRFGAAFALSVVGILVLGVSGWLGGILSYKKHLGMEPDNEAEALIERRDHLVHQ